MRTALLLVAVLLMTATTAGWAASDYFLKIDGVEGESQKAGHENEIDIQSWSWGASTRRDAASGQATGKRQHKPITITKRLDKSTPKLMEACANGTHYPKVVITLRTSGDTGKEETYLTITMEDVMISSYSVNGASADDRPTEEVAFYYNKITYAYTPAGSPGDTEEYSDTWKASR